MASDHLSPISSGGQRPSPTRSFARLQGKSGAAVHAVWENAMIIHDVYGSEQDVRLRKSFYIVGHHDFGMVRHQNFAVRRIRV